MPLNICRTRDMHIVRDIMLHPKVWPYLHDDGLDDFHPTDEEHIYWMLVRDESPAGVFMVYAHNSICYEMHTAILPRIWGSEAAHAAQLLLAWAFSEMPCQKMITSVPSYNRMALRFAKQGGMTVEGTNRFSYLKNGVLHDQILLGITKEEFLCQQQQ